MAKLNYIACALNRVKYNQSLNEVTLVVHV